MLRRLRLRRSFWGAIAVGILAAPSLMGGTAAAPAESLDQLPEPELNPLALLPPDPAELLNALLREKTRLFDDLAPDRYQMLVASAAHRHRLDPRLIASVITVETNWDADAVGSYGELGLMQVLPSTGEWLAKRMGLSEYDLSDPETSIEMGAYYLSMLVEEHHANEVALAVYNGGPRAVDGWETNPYMLKVMEVYNRRTFRPEGEDRPYEDPFGIAFASAS